MKCHYEVLGVAQNVNDQELKLAYRQLALKWHPDKNIQNQEEATEIFKSIQLAYEILSDPVERAYYDKNREHLLRDGRPPEELNLVNVFEFFTTSCFKGYTDSESGFFAVYRKVFADIAAEEEQDLPGFGDSRSGYADSVGPFYRAWESFCTSLEYEWIVKEDPTLCRERWYTRACNKENQKARDAARKERNINVRSLAQFVKKRDPRVKAYLSGLQEKQEAHKKYLDEQRQQQRLEKLKKIEDFQEAEWMPLDELERQLEALEAEHDKIQLEGDEEDSLFCVVCDKLFMSIKSFENHVRSKKHKQNEELVKQQMQEDEENYRDEDLNENDGESENEIDDNRAEKMTAAGEDTAHVTKEPDPGKCTSDRDSDEERKKPKSKRKNKKKQILVARLTDSETEATGVSKPGADSSDDVDFSKNSSTKDRRRQKNSARIKETQPEEAAKEKVAPAEAVKPEGEETRAPAPAPPATVKLKGHKAREARRKARKQEETTPTPVGNRCATCGAEFPSRNKMFAHFNRTNHAQYVGK
ncbi:dnaJ homolog subfamily C member 21 [Galendromus occidentalis]|uniref:DnaJ homolog subfamily C member 21 n=1 Tax=Galendromus occidentalis TaxID=34638 RepID=A0AAJ6VWM8_9ACAR|nr:dnaJ homolog subfamily C member 21 [Galendromus occidentalis]